MTATQCQEIKTEIDCIANMIDNKKNIVCKNTIDAACLRLQVLSTKTASSRVGRPPLDDTDDTLVRAISIPSRVWASLPEPRAATIREALQMWLASRKPTVEGGKA